MLIYYVLNRANARLPTFEMKEDFGELVAVIAQAVSCPGKELYAFCVVSKHWHLAVNLHEVGELSQFAGWLTHTQRWHAHRHSAGTGHIDQSQFNSFPVQDEEHFLTVCR